MTYSDFVKVAPRFSRAVNIERDVALAGAVDGYIVTSTAEAVLDRLVRALREPVGHRSWTLTGPYGSGKSAFGVFLANLFGPAGPSNLLARQVLAKQQRSLFNDLFGRRRVGSLPKDGFCPVVVTGGPEPFVPVLLRALVRDVRNYCGRGRPLASLKVLERLKRKAESGKKVSGSELVAAISALGISLQRTGRSQGILLIIDELGKLLEFAARDPEADHVHVLQQLAEATAGSSRPTLFLVAILHQSFESYAAGLRPAVREEWAKVQGRFEDIAFQEPPDEFVALLASAIQQNRHTLNGEMRARARREAETALRLDLGPRGVAHNKVLRMLEDCAPLHPLTVFVLAKLCRKFGQNQRSLFSFLTSQEPHGFSEFLSRQVDRQSVPLYRIEELYDFVAQSFGSGLAVGEASSRWAEAQSALDRAEGAREDERRIIKAIGLLSAVGSQGSLKPSLPVLQCAVGDANAAKEVTRRLSRQSLLVYRKHSDAFALWEGSDIDLDSRVMEAELQLPNTGNLRRRITDLWEPRALVAKRHSIQTGTLRYFAVRFADVEDLLNVEDDVESDGLLIYVLPTSSSEIDRAINLATTSSLREQKRILVAIPRDLDALRDAMRELELLHWVEGHTPELQGDAVARRELKGRLSVAEEHLKREMESLFEPGQAVLRKTRWYRAGLPQQLENAQSLSHLLSTICDAEYPHTPRLHNELLNRRALSSAAAAARRNLIEAMIVHTEELKLGIQGAPPEFSMYVSALRATGIHRLEGMEYGFGAPATDPGLSEVWKAIERFFAACELERRSVAHLFDTLRRPPFGLKAGVIPVLFCAAALAHDTEIAFYEDGAFVPEVTIEVFERLLRTPEKFHLRRYRIAGIRKEVFNRFATLLDSKPQKTDSLISIVRPLFRFFNKLPNYSKQTTKLSPTALAVREALFASREPDALLFDELPRACATAPFLPTTPPSGKDIAAFFKHLKRALSELQRAYDDLLSESREVLWRAFNVSGDKAREIVRFRARTLAEYALESRLRAFILLLADDEAEDVQWIESIASLLAGKPAINWSDGDRARYELNLSELARSFRHLEALAMETGKRVLDGTAPVDVIRIGVTDRYAKDLEAVVVVQPEQQDQLARAVIEIESALEHAGVGNESRVALAALAIASRKLLAELDEGVPSQKMKSKGSIA